MKHKRLRGGGVTRRQAAFGGGIAALVAAAGGWLADQYGELTAQGSPDLSGTRPAGHQGVAAADSTGTTVMQIVAHPDDDLYFMNPEVMRDITLGRALVSVYLTCGEADGVNGPIAQGRVQAPVSWAAYAAARQEGLRRAYGEMALGDPGTDWTRRLLTLSGGKSVELDIMTGRPEIRLAFFNLPEAHDTNPKYRGKSLTTLWRGICRAQPVIPVEDGLVGPGPSYTRAQLITALAELMTVFTPAVVRTTNPDPQHLPTSRTMIDHPDHGAAALFVFAAVEAHRAAGYVFQAESYIGYDSTYWPEDLDPQQYAQKAGIVETYGWANRSPCTYSFGCGDLKVGEEDGLSGYTPNTEYRYQAATGWLTVDKAGALRGYATVGGDAVLWQENSAGSSTMRGPTPAAPGPLTPRVHAALLPDGDACLAAVRMNLPRTVGTAQTREVVVARQKKPGGAFAAWTSLGNPDQTNPAAGLQIGSPELVADAGGNMYVFVRDYSFALFARMLAVGGTWTPWTRISSPGLEIQDGLSSVRTADGGVALLAAGRHGMYLWTVPDNTARTTAASPKTPPGKTVPAKSRSPFTQVMLLPDSVNISASPSLAALPGGELIAYYRPQRSNQLGAVLYTPDVVARPSGYNGVTPRPPALDGDTVLLKVGRPGGYGPIATAVAGSATDPAVLLVTRDDACAAGYTWHNPLQVKAQSPHAAPSWQSLDGSLLHAPSAVLDAHGRAVIGAFGTDGVLRLARQSEPGPDAGFSDWTAAGTPGTGPAEASPSA
jgi:LmbE family N-acetylglucosaminyl deacetylase